MIVVLYLLHDSSILPYVCPYYPFPARDYYPDSGSKAHIPFYSHPANTLVYQFSIALLVRKQGLLLLLLVNHKTGLLARPVFY